MPVSSPALGKCDTCMDQLLEIPPRVGMTAKRVICPTCTANELADLVDKLLIKEPNANLDLHHLPQRN